MASSSAGLLLNSTTLGVVAGAVGAVALLLLLRRRSGQEPAPSAAPPPTPLGKKPTAAGHAGNYVVDGFFYKLETHRFENERKFLEQLRDGSDPLKSCAPEYHGVEVREGKRYLKMRSLLREFDTPTLCICLLYTSPSPRDS